MRSLPLVTYSDAPIIGKNMKSTRPDITSVSAGALPLKGMWFMCVPVFCSSSAAARCAEPPTPAVP
jgi:hypothetical protein